MPNAIRWQNQTGADPPTEAMAVDTSQRTQVGIVTVVKSVEEGGYDDCFTCGSSGHVACECTSRRNLDLFFGYPVS